MAILLIAYGHILPKLFEFFKLNIEIAQNIFDCFWDIAENMGVGMSTEKINTLKWQNQDPDHRCISYLFSDLENCTAL